MHVDATFGRWVKQRRKALDLTQDDLARAASCSIETIRKIEGDRLRPSRETAERLADTLGVPPGERAAFLLAARAQPGMSRVGLLSEVPGATLEQSTDRWTSRLPAAPTPLIGREQDVAAVRARLLAADVRLVTLVGPGGIGKTRLGLHVARELVDAFPDGVYLVALAQISDPDLVGSTIAQSLGLAEVAGTPLVEFLIDTLRHRHLLLLLDNFEQVIAAAPLVSTLLAAAPRLKLLVTSRAALRVSAEHEYEVPPLELPDLKRRLSPAELAQVAAVQLFLQRAHAVKPTLTLTPANTQAIAEICVRLDGLPLAIELAAVRSKLFTPQTLLRHLASRLALLTGGPRDLPERQQTLRATIAWSYDLLETAERRLFARLAVFVGGCTLEAAAAVAGDHEAGLNNGGGTGPTSAIWDELQSLLDKSLLRVAEPAGAEPRFTMLETTREFALERLQADGEAATLRRRHALYYLELAEAAEAALIGPAQVSWLDRLEGEHDNLRAALEWASETAAIEISGRLVAALWRFWHLRSHLSEGRRWLDHAHAAGTRVPAALRAKVLTGLGTLTYIQGDYERAATLHEQSLDLYRALNDQRGIAIALNNLGSQLQYQGAYERAATAFAESLNLFRDLGDTWGIAHALNNLGSVAAFQGDYRLAMTLFEESLPLTQQVGDKLEIAIRLHNLGDVARRLSQLARAAPLLEQSITLFREVGNTWGVANTLYVLALVAQEQGDDHRSTALFEEGLSRCTEIDDKQGIALCLEGLARVKIRQAQRPEGSPGEALRAAQLCGAAEALRETIGAPIPPSERADYAAMVDLLRAWLGSEVFAASWAEGRALSAAEIVAGLEHRSPAT